MCFFLLLFLFLSKLCMWNKNSVVCFSFFLFLGQDCACVTKIYSFFFSPFFPSFSILHMYVYYIIFSKQSRP